MSFFCNVLSGVSMKPCLPLSFNNEDLVVKGQFFRFFKKLSSDILMSVCSD